MARFEIKITRDLGEIEEAQRLRFQVFNLEMKKGLQASYEHGLDVDEFDTVCDHWIVRDVKSREIVGTYRLLLVRGRVIALASIPNMNSILRALSAWTVSFWNWGAPARARIFVTKR